jgi:hypothetical protein
MLNSNEIYQSLKQIKINQGDKATNIYNISNNKSRTYYQSQSSIDRKSLSGGPSVLDIEEEIINFNSYYKNCGLGN